MYFDPIINTKPATERYISGKSSTGKYSPKKTNTNPTKVRIIPVTRMALENRSSKISGLLFKIMYTPSDTIAKNNISPKVNGLPDQIMVPIARMVKNTTNPAMRYFIRHLNHMFDLS